MRKITPIKGIEIRGTRTFVPGAEIGPAEPNVHGHVQANIYAPNTLYAPSPTVEQDYGSIWFTAGPASFYTNNAGTSLSFYNLGNINPSFPNVIAAMYPGAALDDNDIQVEIPVPMDLDPVDPQIQVRLHFVMPY